MKLLFISKIAKRIALCQIIILPTSCQQTDVSLPQPVCSSSTPINPAYSKAVSLQKILNQYAMEGMPGIALAVYTPEEGFWEGTAGYARIEDGTSMQPCHLQYIQSITKMYMAVAILKIYEQGKIDLDKPITTYLPEKIIKYVHSADKITVRMLLNHTSGVPEYSDNPQYISYLLQHPLHVFSTEDYLGYIDGKKVEFEPGSRFAYKNTDFLLLALIADHIHGDHAKLIHETVLQPLGLQETFYRNDSGYLKYAQLVNNYLDRYGKGEVENVSKMQQINVASLIGDDGIVATPANMITFLRGLIEGKLLSPQSMQQMMTWVNESETNKPIYGLGMYHVVRNGKVAYGHGGGGIGTGCSLYYFPEKKIFFFLSVNLGTLVPGPLVNKASSLQGQVIDALLE